MRTCSLIIAFCLIGSPIAASAQHNGSTVAPRRLIITDKAVAEALAAEQPAMRNRRDSVKNGAVIGAIVGAAVMGGFIAYLCNALKEPGDPPCRKSSGLAIAIGAGTDALFVKEQRLPVSKTP